MDALKDIVYVYYIKKKNQAICNSRKNINYKKFMGQIKLKSEAKLMECDIIRVYLSLMVGTFFENHCLIYLGFTPSLLVE